MEQIFERIIATDVASSSIIISYTIYIGGIGCDNMTAIVIQLKNR
jgi:hypothetical protein